MKKTGLFFGSFNPIHVGHLIIANYMAQQTDLDEVWLIVSPQNPLKKKSTLAKDYDRLHLVKLAVENNPLLRASDLEFKLPKPSYTVETLVYAREKYPEREFVLIMGGDNLATLHKWKNYEVLLREYQIYVYNRPGFAVGEYENHPRVSFFEAPLMQISASYVRNLIREGKSAQYLLSDPVFQYLELHPIYK